MATVRCDIAWVYRVLITQLKTITDFKVYTAAEDIDEDQTVWGRVLSFKVLFEPRISSDAQEDLATFTLKLGICVDPDRIDQDGAYAPATVAQLLAAAVDEFVTVDGSSGHVLHLDRPEIELSEPEDELTELVLGLVTVGGRVTRGTGSSGEDNLT